MEKSNALEELLAKSRKLKQLQDEKDKSQFSELKAPITKHENKKNVEKQKLHKESEESAIVEKKSNNTSQNKAIIRNTTELTSKPVVLKSDEKQSTKDTENLDNSQSKSKALLDNYYQTGNVQDHKSPKEMLYDYYASSSQGEKPEEIKSEEPTPKLSDILSNIADKAREEHESSVNMPSNSTNMRSEMSDVPQPKTIIELPDVKDKKKALISSSINESINKSAKPVSSEDQSNNNQEEHNSKQIDDEGVKEKEFSDYVQFKKPKKNTQQSEKVVDKRGKLKKSAMVVGLCTGAVAIMFVAGYGLAHNPNGRQSNQASSSLAHKSVKLKRDNSKLADFKSAKSKSEPTNSKYTKEQQSFIDDLTKDAKATKQPFKVTIKDIGGGYILGNINYYPDDATKQYNDYSIKKPEKPANTVNNDRSNQIEGKLKEKLPTINKTIHVIDKNKVSMQTYQMDQDTYDTILLYDNVPFGFIKTDKDNNMVNVVTSYYIQHVTNDK